MDDLSNVPSGSGRIECLDQALTHIAQSDGVWKATGSEFIDWCASKGR